MSKNTVLPLIFRTFWFRLCRCELVQTSGKPRSTPPRRSPVCVTAEWAADFSWHD